MAVTIGEIEVTTAPAPAPAGANQTAPPAPGGADVQKEIEKTMRRHAERARRLWAY
jgi:hypothetical protein